jgi:hypothetical protein
MLPKSTSYLHGIAAYDNIGCKGRLASWNTGRFLNHGAISHPGNFVPLFSI